MREYLNDKLNTKRQGVGGLLFLISAMAIAGILMFSSTISRASMVRSVAESIEHTVALECLASCYVNPSANEVKGDSTSFSAGHKFVPFSNDVQTIDPLAQFNEIMYGFKLIPADMPDGSSNSIEITYTIHKDTTTGYGYKQPSLSLQVGPFHAFNSWWLQGSTIQPKKVEVVIEQTYSEAEGGWSAN